jgi:hypothetical protein
MDTAKSLIAFAGLITACTGYGLAALWASGTVQHLRPGLERVAVSFVLGSGLFGWILFFPGVSGAFGPLIFWIVICIGLVLCVACCRTIKGFTIGTPFTMVQAAIISVLLIAGAFDLLEALSPAADADSLAYHFALPRDFIAAGRIEFVPRAVSGAIPLLYHMNYAAALAAGGELALTLWTMTTGWATGLLLYVLSRRYLGRVWSLVLLAIFATTPAVLYGGGSGQVEIRCAGAALAAAAFIVSAGRENSLRLFAVAGFCAGLFMAGKYFGLIFVGAAGLYVLFQCDGTRRVLVFGAAAAIAGFQWYLWNGIHTGDPIFPTLTNLMQFPDSDIWTRDFGLYFSDYMMRSELHLERSFLNWIAYPVFSIFDLVPSLEGGRTGLGIALPLILPFAFYGIFRAGEYRRELLGLVAIAAIFYTVWFFSGTTQRTRHLLPIYPIILLGLFPAAVLAVKHVRVIWPLGAGLGAILAVQLAGHAVFTLNSMKYFFSGETRSAYLYRNVPGANAAEWINQHLPPGAKVAFLNRQLAFLIERPSFLLHPHIQAVIDARPSAHDERRFVSGLRRVGISHLLVTGDWENPATARIRNAPFFDMIGRLVETGCLRRVKQIETIGMASRTLSLLSGKVVKNEDWVLVISSDMCPRVTAQPNHLDAPVEVHIESNAS